MRRQGSSQLTPKLYLATAANELGEDITSLVRSGKVSYAEDRTTPMAFAAVVRDPSVVSPFVDFLAPFLTITYPDGTILTEQVGLYAVAPPARESDPHQTVATLDGRDLTWLVGVDSFDTAYTVAVGANRAATVRSILDGMGIRHAIPDDGSTFAVATSWQAGTSKLDIINGILTGMAFYNLYAMRDGTLATMPYRSLADLEPAVTYSVPATGKVRVLADPIRIEPLTDRLANRVVVRKDSGVGALIQSIRTNDNPLSAISTAAIGYTITRWADGNDVQSLDTQAAADALARRLLEESAAVYERLTITTSRDFRNPHEVYALAIANANGDTIADGNWWCSAWELGFMTGDGPMTHTVNKIVPFEGI